MATLLRAVEHLKLRCYIYEMRKIYIARHGQDEDNANGILNGRRNTPLTSIGIEQANASGDKIKQLNLDIDKIYSSPLERAFRTAKIIADKLNLSGPEKLDLLIERDFGIMTSEPIKSIEEKCAPDIIKSNPIVYFLSPSGAETFEQLVSRAKNLLAWLDTNSNDKNVLLVTHGDIGKMIYTAFYDLNYKDVLLDFHFGNSEILLLDKNSKPEERRLHVIKQLNS